MLTIIVPVYNEKKYLLKILKKIIKIKIKKQIIVVDDGSKDGSTEILKEFTKKRY